MNLKQLEAFVRVADNSSFSNAAKKMALKQSTVSCHISSLEKELKVRLFIRNTKDVKLSKDGEILYQYAKQMIDMEGRIKKIFISNKKKDEDKCVNIAASSIPMQYLLPDLLAKYMESYPNNPVKVVEMDSKQVIEKVNQCMVNIGLTGTMIEKTNCKYMPIYQDELVIAAPNLERYQKIKFEETHLQWIMKEPIIVREEGSGTRKEAERQLQKLGVNVEGLNIVACMENPEVIKRSVKNGLGITIISKLAIEKEVERGEILEIPLSSQKLKRDLYLIYNKNSYLSKSTEEFIQLVKELM